MPILQPNLQSIFASLALLLFIAINCVRCVQDQAAYRCVNPPLSKEELIDYFYRNCYLFRAEFEKRKVNPLDIHLENAIRKMQQINQLEVVGVLNTETCRKINETLVDPLPIHKIRNRIRRFSYNDFKWEKQNITYWYKTAWPAGNYRNEHATKIVEKSFSLWSDVVALSFKRTPYFWAADIKIKFVRRNHGDGYNFDGPGSILGHAFVPDNLHRSARIHLDSDEKWNLRPGKQAGLTSMLHVLTHEIGHALGLSHSEAPGGILFRAHNDVEKLCEDDIVAIGNLYADFEKQKRTQTFWRNKYLYDY